MSKARLRHAGPPIAGVPRRNIDSSVRRVDVKGAQVRLIRNLSALLLVSQLFWLAAPALCHMPATAPCHQASLPGDHGQGMLPGVPSSTGCAMPAVCGVPAPAVIHPVVALSFATPLHRISTVERSRFQPADPAAPLLPPPEV